MYRQWSRPSEARHGAVEVPRTVTPMDVCVPREGGTMLHNSWHALLCGSQQFDLPISIASASTDELVTWYQKRELKRGGVCVTPVGVDGSLDKVPIEPVGHQMPLQPCPVARKLPSSPTHPIPLQQRPASDDLMPLIRDRGWRRVRTIETWAEQARALATWRVSVRTQLPVARDRALHERLWLLEQLECKGVSQGIEALRFALRLRFGSLQNAFANLDVGGHGEKRGVSLLEFSGSLALLGLHAPSLCGFGVPEVFRRLDADCDGRISLEDLCGSCSSSLVGSDPVASRSACATVGDPGGTMIANLSSTAVVDDAPSAGEISLPRPWAPGDIEEEERWALIARIAALSSWFRVSPPLRRRGRADCDCEKEQLHSPKLPHPPWGVSRLGVPEALDGLQFRKISGSVAPIGWRLATHTEAKVHFSDIVQLLEEWDICGLADWWRIDGHGYGNNIKEPWGPVDFASCIIRPQDTAPAASAPSDAPAGGSIQDVDGPSTAQDPADLCDEHGGVLEQQEALCALRRCWAPNEGDLEEAQQALKADFEIHATARQFGTRLLSRADLCRLLADAPAQVVSDKGAAQRLTRVDLGRIHDEVLERQMNLTALHGCILSKGLTFDSLPLLTQKIALFIGLHFRHLVDDAVEACDDEDTAAERR